MIDSWYYHTWGYEAMGPWGLRGLILQIDPAAAADAAGQKTWTSAQVKGDINQLTLW